MQQLRITLEYTHTSTFDLDITAFMLANDKYIPNENFMVYYHNLISADGSVKYEQALSNGLQNKYLDIDLGKTAQEIEEIYFIISIYDAANRNQSFGKIPQAQVHIVDTEMNKKLNTYIINTNFPHETSIELGRLFARNGRWRWETLSVGYKESLEKFVNKYVF